MKDTESFLFSYCVAQTFTPCDKYQRIRVERNKIYFVSPFQSFQSMVTWLHCFWPWPGRTSWWKATGKETYSSHSWWTKAEKEIERKRQGTVYILQLPPPVTCFLHLGLTSKYSHHLQIMPSNYESSMDIPKT
jgi:hypothetical protein